MSENEKQTPETGNESEEPQLQFASADDLEGLTDANPLEASGETDPLLDVQSKLAAAEKRCLIAQADLENFRRRNRKETQDQLRYASGPLMTELLEAVDNLHRAVESFEQSPGSEENAEAAAVAVANGEALNEGVKLVASQIQHILTKYGCKPIEAVGQPFDPNLHQALQMQASAEHPAQTVMMDLRAGFQLHDRVLRPSQVFVSTGPAE